MTKITNVAMGPLVHILEHLRPEDQEEMLAVHGARYNIPVIADVIFRLASQHAGWLFWGDGPVAAVGAYAMTETCAGVWAFGTAGWPVVSVTRHVKKVMVPRLLKAGFHRAECRALFKRSDTKRWLTYLGFEAEAVLSEFGTRREDFILFARVAHEPTDHPSRSQGRPRDQLPLRNGG